MAEIDDRPRQAVFDLDSPQHYVNRELSLIEFQRRVLEEAKDPSVPLLERVRFLSIVGRFLEHSRVFYFRNGGDEEVFLGSADLMPRNLNGRVEVMFPVSDPRLVNVVREEILGAYLADAVKARVMNADGTYERIAPHPGARAVNAQSWFLSHRATPRLG